MEDEEFSKVFQETSSEYVYVNPDPDASTIVGKTNYGDEVVANIEAEYLNQPDVAKERKEHKERLIREIKVLNTKLLGIKNIRNHRMKTQNAKTADRRKLIKKQISELKEELYAIETEEKGSSVTSSSLVDATVLSKDSDSRDRKEPTPQELIVQTFQPNKLSNGLSNTWNGIDSFR